MRMLSRFCYFSLGLALASMSLAIAPAQCDEADKVSVPAVTTVTGDATVTPVATSGACSVTTCNAGSCFCETYTEALSLTQIGNVNLTLNITYNGTNDTNSGGGQGLCFPFSGVGTFNVKNGSASFTVIGGTACNNFDLESEGIFITNAGFFIDPAKGTGALAGASGTGNIVVTHNLGPNTAIIHVDGNFQK